MRLSFTISESGDISIVGDRESVLVVIEAARRDLNALAQAPGASPEWKNRYGKLASELAAQCSHVPRINLTNRDPMAGIGPTVLIDPAEDREALEGAGEVVMACGDEPPRVCAHPDDMNSVFPHVDEPEEDARAVEEMDIEDLLG